MPPVDEADDSIDADTATPAELANFYFQSMTPLAELMAEADLVTRKDIAAADLRRTSIAETYLRCAAWAKTLSLLDSLVHVQAVGAGSRALFEALIDMMIFHRAETDLEARRMRAWERWSKLQAAQKACNHVGRRRLDRDLADDALTLLRRDGDSIREGWARYGKSGYTSRWTGAPLAADAAAADDGAHSCVPLAAHELETFAETRVPALHTLVHCSGGGGMRGDLSFIASTVNASVYENVTHCVRATRIYFCEFPFTPKQPRIRKLIDAYQRRFALGFVAE